MSLKIKPHKALVINLFGAPGAGKSTGAAYIFSRLKMVGLNAELVTEFAKDKVWEGATAPFENQLYILGDATESAPKEFFGDHENKMNSHAFLELMDLAPLSAWDYPAIWKARAGVVQKFMKDFYED